MYPKYPKIFAAITIACLVTILPAGGDVRAQSSSVLAAGLRAPSRLCRTSSGNLIVAEGGGGSNTGRISIVDASGAVRTLVDGLPSAFAPPEGDPVGPSGLAMRGRNLYVTIGSGDGTMAGPAPGSEVPNPNPTSPILSSVLAIHFSASVERSSTGFSLTVADHSALANGETLKLKNSPKDKITVRLVADFANYEPDPRPDVPDNVRSSNPFGIAVDGRNLYVVDASLNRLTKIDSRTGGSQVLTTFAPVANPLPFGPPMIDFVPDSVRVSGASVLVTNLTGFPFPQGLAEVRRVDASTGAEEPFIGGLSSAIDVLKVDMQGGATRYYVLEFSIDMLGNPPGPGQLLRFDSPTAEPVVVRGDLITPTGMERDPATGDIFVTEFFTGRIIRVTGG